MAKSPKTAVEQSARPAGDQPGRSPKTPKPPNNASELTGADFAALVERGIQTGFGVGVESMTGRVLRARNWEVRARHRFLSPEDFSSWEEIDIEASKTLELVQYGRNVKVVLHVSCSSSRKYGWGFYVLNRNEQTKGRAEFAAMPFVNTAPMRDFREMLPSIFWTQHDGFVAEGATAWSGKEEARDHESKMFEKIFIALQAVASALWQVQDPSTEQPQIHIPIFVYDGHLALGHLDLDGPRMVSVPPVICYRGWYDLPAGLRSELRHESSIQSSQHAEVPLMSRICAPCTESFPARLRMNAMRIRLDKVPTSYLALVMQPSNFEGFLANLEKSFR